ncbi:MAG: hypothetical protein J0665_12635 [Deltaproteobacteria bacterium]|nr:hypothetical protein [Deltaproteobacteria bacterium]
MTNSAYVRASLVEGVLENVPPMIRNTLLEESGFREEYGITLNTVLSFGDPDNSVKRSDLFDAIRKSLSGASVIEVTDTDGQKWEIENISNKGELPRLAFSRSEQRLILPDYCAVLSPDSATRLRFVDQAASDVNLPSSVRIRWHKVLTERALENDEVDAFQVEFCDTPVEKTRSIRSEILAGQSSISSLVPHSRRYFERLVGAYDGSVSIQNYTTGILRKLFNELTTWRPYDGFLFSLFLSSHSALTAEIDVDQLDSDALVRALKVIDTQGDRISQLGAIEVGFRILPLRPEIEPILVRLIKQIRDDDIHGQASGFKLLSALFILVDGELSKARLYPTEPPFYRRLAALSHASLIQRQLVSSGIDIDQFCKWAIENRGEQYYFQSLADMRIEPRWNPDLAEATQIKAYFFGRIIIAAKNYEKNFKDSELCTLVLGTDDPGSIISLGEFPHLYFPGPLEGAEDTSSILPPELSEMIETQLGKEVVGPLSFVALVNSALIFRVGSDQAELAANALRIGNHRLIDIKNRGQLLTILNGLATVAAVTRNCALADELRILIRRYRHDAQYSLSIQEATTICLIAAASRADLNNWREFMGDWLTELAFNVSIGIEN